MLQICNGSQVINEKGTDHSGVYINLEALLLNNQTPNLAAQDTGHIESTLSAPPYCPKPRAFNPHKTCNKQASRLTFISLKITVYLRFPLKEIHSVVMSSEFAKAVTSYLRSLQAGNENSRPGGSDILAIPTMAVAFVGDAITLTISVVLNRPG